MIVTHRLIVRLRRHPSSALLAAQLLGVLLYPLLQDSASGQIALAVFGLVVLGLALRMVRRSPAATQSALALAACVVVFSVWNALAPDRRLLLAVSLLEAAFYFYAAGALIRYMLQDDVATTDELVAAGATFTVLAWAWAHLYMACQVLAPGSFIAAVRPDAARSWFELLFLSFTSLSRVGLGDVVPVKPRARALVLLEEFAGVMYIALVVSRLVGLLTLRRMEQHPPQ